MSPSSIDLYVSIFNCAYIGCSLSGVSQLNRIKRQLYGDTK